MSATYQVNGYIDIRLPIDDTFQCSQSSTPNEIAEIVQFSVESKIGSFEVLKHGLILKRIS